MTGPLYAAVLDRAGVTSGTRLLDLGCGRGEFAAAAVARGAVVTGIDIDPAAVAAVAVEGTFSVGDAHDPPDGPFDVAAAVQLLGHVRNPVLVLRRAGAVASVVAVAVWGRDEECDVRAFGEALAAWLPPPRPAGGPPPVTEPARLARLVELAGLRVDSVDEVVCPFDYPSADELVGPVLAAGIGRAAARAAGPAAVRTAVLERCATFRTADGGYRLNNLFRVLVAQRRRDRHTY